MAGRGRGGGEDGVMGADTSPLGGDYEYDEKLRG